MYYFNLIVEETETEVPYFAVYKYATVFNTQPHVWPKLLGEKTLHFNFLIQIFVYI